MENKRKSFYYVLVLIILVLVGGGYYFYSKNKLILPNILSKNFDSEKTTHQSISPDLLSFKFSLFSKTQEKFMIKDGRSLFVADTDKSLWQLLSLEEPTPFFEFGTGFSREQARITPFWSPDKRWVLVEYSTVQMNNSSSGITVAGLGIIDTEDSSLEFKPLVSLNNHSRPFLGFSPDSKLLAYATTPQNPVITIINVATREVVSKFNASYKVRDGGAVTWVNSNELSYVSDGRLYVYSVSSGKASEVYPGSSVKKFTEYAEKGFIADWTMWSPDAKFVILNIFPGENNVADLYILNVEKKVATKLTGYSALPLGFSKDSKSFYFTDGDKKDARIDLPSLSKTIAQSTIPSGFNLSGQQSELVGDAIFKNWYTYPTKNQSMDGVITTSTGEIACPNNRSVDILKLEMNKLGNTPISIETKIIKNDLFMTITNLDTCSRIIEINSPVQSNYEKFQFYF